MTKLQKTAETWQKRATYYRQGATATTDPATASGLLSMADTLDQCAAELAEIVNRKDIDE
jgi:hypothetical protein